MSSYSGRCLPLFHLDRWKRLCKIVFQDDIKRTLRFISVIVVIFLLDLWVYFLEDIYSIQQPLLSSKNIRHRHRKIQIEETIDLVPVTFRRQPIPCPGFIKHARTICSWTMYCSLIRDADMTCQHECDKLTISKGTQINQSETFINITDISIMWLDQVTI